MRVKVHIAYFTERGRDLREKGRALTFSLCHSPEELRDSSPEISISPLASCNAMLGRGPGGSRLFFRPQTSQSTGVLSDGLKDREKKMSRTTRPGPSVLVHFRL